MGKTNALCAVLAVLAGLSPKPKAKPTPKSIRIPVSEVARCLRHESYLASGNGETWLDVRLQVLPDGDWRLHSGSPDYDTDHHGVWGADSIPVRPKGNTAARFNAHLIAKVLINQACDMAVDSHQFPGDVNFYYAR